MQKKRSISQNKNQRKKSLIKKKPCQYCQPTLTIMIKVSLNKKYSSSRLLWLNSIDKLIQQSKIQKYEIQQECLQKYYKNVHRKHEFKKIKQIYKMHNQYPRLFMPDIRDIINKCHHRKRLLEYFRIAKILGIKVEPVKFSTFLLSLSKSYNPLIQKKKSYDRLIGQISGYEFSEQIQRQIIQTLNCKENDMNLSNFGVQNPLCEKIFDNKRQQETASSIYGYRFKIQ